MLQLFRKYFEKGSFSMSNSFEPVPPENKRSWLYNKWTIISLLALLVLIIIPGSLYSVHVVQAELLEKEQLVAEQQLVQKLETEIYPDNQFVQTKEGDFLTFADPTLSDEVKAATQEFIAKTTAKENGADLILSAIHVQPITAKVGEIVTKVIVYDWDTEHKTYKEMDQQVIDPTYIDLTTQKAVTTKDLITDEAHLMSIHNAVQQALLKEAKDPESILDQVLDLPAFDWDTQMIYSPQSLTVVLPKNKEQALDRKKVTLSYPDIARAVNAEYVEPSIVATFPKNEANGKKQIALTFDDGPNPATTPSILATLKEKNVHATFFQLGQQVEKFPDLAKQVHEEGHLIGSHTFHHLNLVTQSNDLIQDEIRDTDKAIFKASGILPTLIRPPYGAVNKTVADYSGRPIIQWDIDSLDWKTKNAAKTLQQIQTTIIPNGIILMHDIQPSTAAVLPQLIDWLQGQGYELVTVDQLLDYDALPLHQYFSQDDERVIS